jgi:hypothetical protein
LLHSDAKSLQDLLESQPTLLRLFPSSLGLDAAQGLELLCLGGMALAFVAMISRSQRNSILFALLWALYLSVFQVNHLKLFFLLITYILLHESCSSCSSQKNEQALIVGLFQLLSELHAMGIIDNEAS